MKEVSRFSAGKFIALLSLMAVAVFSQSSVANDVIWNNGTANFVGSQTWSYVDPNSDPNSPTLLTTDDPFSLTGEDGITQGGNLVIIGNDGDVTLNSVNGPFSDNSLFELRVGTLAPEADLSAIDPNANYQGNGTLTVSNNVGLVLFNDGSGGSGNLIVGGASGITGTLNWNSTDSLIANGQLRVGQGGTGTVHQNGGSAIIAATSFASPDARVGSNSGTGIYNLNDGSLQVGSADNGTGVENAVPFQIGFQEIDSSGTFNLGDGSGANNSATLETWGNLSIARGSGPQSRTGVLNIESDGQLIVNYAPLLESSSQILVGENGGSNGSINQTGGTIAADGLMSLGFNLATASYTLNGSTGTVNVRAFEAFVNADVNFNLDAGGATTITVDGNSSTAADTASGNSVTLGNATLNITGLNTYNSLSDITLFDQVDPTASLTGSFANFTQGQLIGQNLNGDDFYFNYFGGTGNDIVLQSTLPSSSTDGLVWNTAAANFDAGWASGDGSFGVASFPVDPFSGLQNLYLGNGGTATYDGTTNDSSGTSVKNLHVGTNLADSIVALRNGNGTLTVAGSENLTVDDASGSSAQGNLFVGEQGFTGTVNWNSSGTLDVQGQLRVGQTGGTGVFNQNDGIVQGGTTAGGGKYIGIGDGSGSYGTYNLNNGTFYPDGVGIGPARRQFRVGHAGATGAFNLGDGVGAAGTAIFESEDDLWIGSNGGNGTLTIESDGAINMLTNNAPIQIGLNDGGVGGQGLVVQNGGSVTVQNHINVGNGSGSVGEYQLNDGTILLNDGDHLQVGLNGAQGTFHQTGGTITANGLFNIGQNAGSTGQYNFSAGVINAAADGGGDFRVGGNGGNGTFRVSGTASFTTLGNFFIAEAGGAGTTGLLELTGSQASFTIDELENAPGTVGAALGNDETISWIADPNGITSIVVAAQTGSDFVQLQDPLEVSANTGTNGNGDLMGDGIALLLDLSALSGTQTLTLIDNQDPNEAVVGFFENGTTMDLYEEGESILGTGFGGSVTISYLGGTGNDVILNLLAGLAGDFDGSGTVDGLDFLAWQRGESPNPLSASDLADWEANYGQTLATPNAASVPEPGAFVMAVVAAAWLAARRPRTIS